MCWHFWVKCLHWSMGMDSHRQERTELNEICKTYRWLVFVQREPGIIINQNENEHWALRSRASICTFADLRSKFRVQNAWLSSSIDQLLIREKFNRSLICRSHFPSLIVPFHQTRMGHKFVSMNGWTDGEVVSLHLGQSISEGLNWIDESKGCVQEWVTPFRIVISDRPNIWSTRRDGLSCPSLVQKTCVYFVSWNGLESPSIHLVDCTQRLGHSDSRFK